MDQRNVDIKSQNIKANEEQSIQGETAGMISFPNFLNFGGGSQKLADEPKGRTENSTSDHSYDIPDSVEPGFQRSVGNALDDMRTAAAFLVKNLSDKEAKRHCIQDLCLAKDLGQLLIAIETVAWAIIAETYTVDTRNSNLAFISDKSFTLLGLCDEEFKNPQFPYTEKKTVWGVKGCKPSTQSEMEAFFIKVKVPEGYSEIVALSRQEILSANEKDTINA